MKFAFAIRNFHSHLFQTHLRICRATAAHTPPRERKYFGHTKKKRQQEARAGSRKNRGWKISNFEFRILNCLRRIFSLGLFNSSNSLQLQYLFFFLSPAPETCFLFYFSAIFSIRIPAFKKPGNC